MLISEATSLIQKAGITNEKLAIWADLGCGSGVFTKALASLLTKDSLIYALDKSIQHFEKRISEVSIQFIKADFESDFIELPLLNGILMANSLHYVKDKIDLIKLLKSNLSEEGVFIIVEYDTMQANEWVPYPIDFIHLQKLFATAGFTIIDKIGSRRSLYNSGNMYACCIKQ